MLGLLLNMLLVLPIVASLSDPLSVTSNIQQVTKEDFISLKEDPSAIRVIYFLKPDLIAQASSEKAHTYKMFFREFDKSSVIIQMYGVKLGIVKCEEENIEGYCDKEEAAVNIYLFRGEQKLLTIGLENMFDVNSIVSNILQVVLLRDVPILQSTEELLKFAERHKSEHDIIFSYQMAIGTYDHRVLMEVAFAFRNTYAFALTTDVEATAGLPELQKGEEAGIWVLRCQQVSAGDTGPCPVLKYTNKKDLSSLAKFLRALQQPSIHDVADDGAGVQFEANGMHGVYIFYDQESLEHVLEEAENLVQQYPGIVGVVMVDVNRVEAAHHGLPMEEKIPALAFKGLNSRHLVFMSPEERPLDFVSTLISEESARLYSAREKVRSRLRSQDSLQVVEEQDDAVAEAVTFLKKKKLVRDHVPALTDKTFGSSTQQADFLLVTFYVTFDARSMAFLYAFIDASTTLHAHWNLQPLAAVDCFDWTDVCSKENVTHYPTTRLYRQGRPVLEYSGMLGAEAVVSFVALAHAGIKGPLSAGEARDFLAGTLPANIDTVASASVLGLFDSPSGQDFEAFSQSARDLDGTLLTGYAVGQAARDIAADLGAVVPSVVVRRRDDDFLPHVVRADLSEATTLTEWIRAHSLPAFVELTPGNFPALFAQKKPFLVLFTGSGRESQWYEVLGRMSAQGAEPDLTVGWMNLESPVAQRVIASYLQRQHPEALVLVNHQQGTVHHYKEVSVGQDALISWLRRVEDGSISPTSTLSSGEWMPHHPGYDFLRMMDEEESEAGRLQDNVQEEISEYNDNYGGTLPAESSGEGSANAPQFSPLEIHENEVRMELLRSLTEAEPGHTASPPRATARQGHTEL